MSISELFMKLTTGLPWKVYVEGDDLVMNKVWATAFGVADPEDSGETASGFSFNKHPGYKGVALPMRGFGVRSLAKSPIPRMKFGVYPSGSVRPGGAMVIIEDRLTGRPSPVVPVLDLGPSLYTGNALDMSVSLAKLFDPRASATNFKRRVNVRMIGAAKYL